MYKNICILKKEAQFYLPSDSIFEKSTSWFSYRGKFLRRSFSWHFHLKIHKPWQLPSGDFRWVNGTSLWYDQSYDHFCHPGHSSEFYNKLLELREYFPEKIDRVIYAIDLEVERKRNDAYQFCSIACNLMRVAFEDLGFTVPPVYWLENHRANSSYKQDEHICFETLLVPPNQFQHFTSQEAASKHRSQALKMCSIPERNPAKHSPSKNIVFFQRAAERYLVNSENLCIDLSNKGFQAYVVSGIFLRFGGCTVCCRCYRYR